MRPSPSPRTVEVFLPQFSGDIFQSSPCHLPTISRTFLLVAFNKSSLWAPLPTDYCVPVSEVPGHQHPLRSARCHQLSVPWVRRSTFGTCAFSVARPTVWNSLPDHLRAIQLLTSNNLGGTWRRICSPDIRSISALEVLRNRALQIDTYLLTFTYSVMVTQRQDWRFRR